MKTNQKELYPFVKKLGLDIIHNPYPHVTGKQLNEVLKAHDIQEKFDELFVGNTCLVLNNGDIGVYPCDIELILSQILENYKPKLEDWD